MAIDEQDLTNSKHAGPPAKTITKTSTLTNGKPVRTKTTKLEARPTTKVPMACKPTSYHGVKHGGSLVESEVIIDDARVHGMSHGQVCELRCCMADGRRLMATAGKHGIAMPKGNKLCMTCCCLYCVRESTG